MIWIYSYGTITAIIVLIHITETSTVIIIAAVIVAPIMIGGSGSCSQSYDDFHDEQDDYDMMDDDF